jgi:periodic tryptophan protein 2
MTDRRTSGNMASGQAFTALAYSADGTFVIAAGTSKWVCVYDTDEYVLLRRFQLSENRALDGVLDQLNSKHLTDGGPLALLDIAEDEESGGVLLPVAAGSAAAAEGLPGAPC